jgi:hypothetical protein
MRRKIQSMLLIMCITCCTGFLDGPLVEPGSREPSAGPDPPNWTVQAYQVSGSASINLLCQFNWTHFIFLRELYRPRSLIRHIICPWFHRSMRFVIKDTVEERILQLQEKKQLVFDG